MNPLSLIKANPVFMGAIGLVVLALGIYVGALKFMLGSARGEAAELRGQNKSLVALTHDWQIAYNGLARKARESNEAIDALKKREADLKNEALQAIKKAEASQASSRAAIIAATARADSVTPGLTCSEGVQSAKSDLRGLK